ncbi:MAG: putative Transposon Ty3-I Gag-Pol polyprotein, partial [Streblomastix strix]
MEKDSGCEQVEYGNREITLQDAWTRGKAIVSILRQIRIHSEIKILNYCDDILLIHSDKQILKTQTIKIMRTLEQFGWTISTDKCETEPKQIITFLGWIWNLKEVNIKVSAERKSKMIQALKDWCNIIYKNRSVKIRQLVAQIGRLIFLRLQIKRSVVVSNGIGQSEDIIVEYRVMGWNNDSEQSSNQKIEMVDKENWGQPTRITDQQKITTCMLTTDASPQGWGATVIYENQIKLIQHDCWIEKEAKMTSYAKEIKAIYDGLLCFEQVFKKMQNQAVLIRSNNTTAVYDIGKWKAKESLIERIKQVFYLVKILKLQITTIHIPEKLNPTIDSLSRLCKSGDYALRDGIIQMICKTGNYMPQIDIFATQCNKLINNYVTLDLNDLGTHFHNAFNYKWSKVKLYIHYPIPVLNRILLKMKQDKAQGTIIAPIWPGQLCRQDSGNGTENERQGSKTSTRQCGRLPSGHAADVGRDMITRCMNMRGYFEERVNLRFKGQRFNTVKRDFYSLALLQDWLDIERITIEEMLKKDAEVILTEVIAFHTRQNKSVASAKSHKACLTIMLSLKYKENLTSSATSKLINKALANATIPYRRYQNIWNIQILFNHWRQSKQNKYLNNYYLLVKIASLLMSVCFFRPNEIAEIRLKFSNVNKVENQASLRLAPKQPNAIEIYEVYETDNESLSPKLAIYEWIDRLKKQFPK